MSTGDTLPEGRSAGRFEPSHLVGTLFADRFRVLHVVSEGANTIVCDARDQDSGRTVTLKLVRPQLASSPSFRNRFHETMRSVAALSHPNIAAVYDWGVTRLGDASTAYVVSEQLTGGSLRDMFDRGRRLSPSQVLVVGLDACRALDYAHRRGFVHSELTPSKLVFGDDRRLRIVDFGLARLLGESAWAQPDSVPTHVAWYASPEQGLSQPIDGKTDVYALCLALHEAVTGTLLFASDSTVASLAARVGKLMPVSADLGPLASVLERAGRPDPDERASAAQLGKGLVQAAAKLPRPEPLPILSTGLFETPIDQMRTPDDPTGGVTRPARPADPVVVVPVDEPDAVGAGPSGVDDRPLDAAPPVSAEPVSAEPVSPQTPVIVEAEPDIDIPTAAPGGDLVILPLDSDIGADRVVERARVEPAGVEPAGVEPTDEPEEPRPPATRVMPVTPEPRRRRSFPWKILLGLVVVGALAALAVMATRLVATPVYEVPDLVGMPEAEARDLIAANQWVITVDRERSDEVPTVGQVVRTAPQSGVDLAEGEPFLVVVSEGPLLRELPESAGVVASEAQTTLAERGLVADPVEAYDEEVPAGTVVSWKVPSEPSLRAGAMVEPDTVVRLVISKGPAPREVPDLTNEPIGRARAALADLKLVLVQAEEVFSDDVPLGSIISQAVKPGTKVERGTDIAVVVSKGPDLVRFPDISDAANYQEVAALVTAAGFVPELVLGDVEAPVQSYTIDGETPDAGDTFARGTTVEFEAY